MVPFSPKKVPLYRKISTITSSRFIISDPSQRERAGLLEPFSLHYSLRKIPGITFNLLVSGIISGDSLKAF